MKIILNLNKKEILEKKFNINLKGYDANEVDYFLDLIIKDYESWELMSKNYKEKILNLKNELEKIKQEKIKQENHIIKYKKEIKELEEKSSSNVELLKRINKLEEKK